MSTENPDRIEETPGTASDSDISAERGVLRNANDHGKNTPSEAFFPTWKSAGLICAGMVIAVGMFYLFPGTSNSDRPLTDTEGKPEAGVETDQGPLIVERVTRADDPAVPNATSDLQPTTSISDSTLIVSFSGNADPDDAVVERLEQWDGPTELRLVRSSRVLPILTAVDEAGIDHLRISYSPLTHDVLAAISELRSLQSLMIYQGGPCDPRYFRELARLEQLTILEINATPLVDGDREGVTALGTLRSLERLVLAEVGPLTARHLRGIHNVKTLTQASIDSPYVTSDAIASWVTTLPQLKQITLPRILVRPSLTDALRDRNIKILPPPIEGSLRVWDTTTGTQLFAGSMTGDVEFIDKGSLLAVEEGTALSLYDVDDGRLVHSFDSTLPYPERGFMPNRDSLYWRNKTEIVIADSSNNRSVLDAFASDGRGVPFRMLPSGHSMAVSGGKSIRILDIATGKLQLELKPSDYFSPSQIEISEDGRYLAASGSSPGVRIWSLESGKELHAHLPHNVLVGFTGNSKTLLCLEDRTVLFAVDVATGKSNRVLTLPAESQPLFHAVKANRFAYASSGKPIVIDVYDTSTWERLHQFAFAGAESHFISGVSLSNDGKRLAVTGNLSHQAD